MPPSLDDWLPQDHLARFVVATVDQLDLSGFARPARADGRGRRSYAPSMLVALVLLAWCEGKRSSRRIEQACIDAMSYRWLTGNEMPDHTTISRFVKDRSGELEDLFGQVLGLAIRAGMGQLGVVSIDGTKMAANASSQKNKTRVWLENEAERIRQEHEANDATDDEMFGDARGDELPVDLADPATRDGRIAEALGQMQAEDQTARAAWETKQDQKDPAKRRGKPPEPTDRKANITDPDARTMKGPRGFYPAFNAQAAVSEDQLIVATNVTQDGADNDQFTAMAQAVTDNLEATGAEQPEKIAADAGYWNPGIFDLEDNRGPEVLVPPAPHPQRTKLKTRGPIPRHATLTQRRERKMATKAAKVSYAKRAVTVEPVFGQIRNIGPMNRFRRRGLDAVRAEWALVATAHNLRKMFKAGLHYAT